MEMISLPCLRLFRAKESTRILMELLLKYKSKFIFEDWDQNI